MDRHTRATTLRPGSTAVTNDVRSAVLRRLTTPHADTRFSEAAFVRPLATELRCRPHEVLEAKTPRRGA